MWAALIAVPLAFQKTYTGQTYIVYCSIAQPDHRVKGDQTLEKPWPIQVKKMTRIATQYIMKQNNLPQAAHPLI